jgi:hypothetical protein
MGIATRSFPPGHFFLEIDGVSAGYARNVQGGGAVAEVIREKVGADHIVHKHIGAVRFDDIVLTCDAGLSKAFYDWVDQTFRSQGLRKNGAVVVLDGGKEVSRLDWNNGLISRVDFPALDATSNDLFSMIVKITPERTRSAKGGESRPVTPARKSWLASSFRLSIEGLEEACKYVSRIEPLAIDWHLKEVNTSGGYRDSMEPAGNVEPGNLIVTLPESKAQGFQDWFEDFAIKGNSGQGREKRGTLESGAFSLQFGNLGISGITRPSDRPGAMIRKTRVEMYCESIRFRAKAA